jgi:bacterioferritin
MEDGMKGNEKILEKLNDLLSDELTAVNQYMVHAEMDDNWEYTRLAGAVEKRAIAEMKHAEKLIERILFLEGTPVVSSYKQINIGADVQKQLGHDWDAEFGAIKSYNDGIKLSSDLGDNGTEQLLKEILKDEEGHINWIEGQKDQVAQVGIQMYLAEQIKE